MASIQKLFMAEIAKAPQQLLQTLIAEKLEAEGLGDRKGLVEALTDHVLNGSGSTFEWDDGSDVARDMAISFTEKDTAKLNALVEKYLAALPDVISRTSSAAAKVVLKGLKKDWPEQAAHEHALNAGFRERLEARWGRAFGSLGMLLTIGRELGEEEYSRLRKSRPRKNCALRSLLVRLHARACQVTAEIITLMENGFADGAMARWRTLYEIGVVAAVVADGGEELAQRYIAHEAVESKLALDEYERCHQALGFKPIPKRERKRVEQGFDAAVKTYGAEFGKANGWAATHLKKRRVTFRELEEAAQRSSTRTYYKMASYGVHADSKGIFFRLGVLGDELLILAGASDAGFVDPGQNTAITLVQITGLLFGERIGNLDAMARMQMLLKLREEAIEEFVRAGRKLDRDHAKLRA